MGKSVLIITTSHNKLGATDQGTGLWAEEIAAPYYVFKNAGLDVTIASVKGGKIPLDEGSLTPDFTTDAVTKFLADPEAKKGLEDSVALESVSENYDAYFVPGGHGVCYDMPENQTLIKLLSDAVAADKVLSSVCHGPAGLVGVKAPDGRSVFAGKKVTGFSNTEEEAVGKTQYVPFLLEDKIKELGGDYSKAEDWHVYTQVDGKLITGQNPQSSDALAHLVVKALA